MQSALAQSKGGTDPDGDTLLGLCEDLVKKALSAGAEQAEVYATHGTHVDVDIEEGKVAFAGTGTRQGGSIRLVADGRLGFAYFVDAPEPAIGHALQAARLAPKKDFHLPTGARVQGLGLWDDAAALLDPADALDLAHGALVGASAACPQATVTGGGASLARGVEAIASSEGVAGHDRSTHCSVGASLVLASSGGSNQGAVSAWHSDQAHGLLDGEAVGQAAGSKTHSLRNPQTIKPGSLNVVFTPEAASELILGGLLGFVDGDDAMRGKSAWSSMLGQQVTVPSLSVVDDPTVPGGLGSTAFDGEGLATHRIPIIEEGNLSTFLFDSFDAHQHGRTEGSTGSCIRGSFQSMPGTGTHQVVVSHRDAMPRNRLLAEVENGLLIDSVLGAHTANPTTGDFSVTSPNNWRIENGEVVGAGEEVAIAGNIPHLLQNLGGASTQERRFSGAILGDLWFRDVSVST